ncbi:MAG: sensor histidine kinase, partial [Bacteroidota bacterium]
MNGFFTYFLFGCMLLSSCQLLAQVDEMEPPADFLERIITKNERNQAHFYALDQLISVKTQQFPDTLLELHTLAAQLQTLGDELGHPYNIYALSGKQRIYAVVCPKLSRVQRDSAVYYYEKIHDLIGEPENEIETAVLARTDLNMFSFCSSKWHQDSMGIVIPRVLTYPYLTDSIRVMAHLYSAVNAVIDLDDRIQAGEHMQEALRIVRTLPGHYPLKVSVYDQLASFYDNFSSDLSLVRKYLSLSRQAAEKISYSRPYDLANYLKLEAINYREQEKYDSSFLLLDSFSRALQPIFTAEPEKYLFKKITQLTSYVKLYQKADSAGAQPYIEEGLALIEQYPALKNERQFYTPVFLGFAGAYLADQGEEERALSLLRTFDKTQRLFTNYTSGKEVFITAYSKMGELEMKQGNYEVASKALARSNDMIKSYYIERGRSTSAKAAFTLEVAENQLAAQQAQQATSLAQTEAAANRRNLIIGLLAATVILGILAWAWLRSRRDAKQIAQQKSMVEKSLSEKEVLLREIHHRVKNNLQIISGMLTKQARMAADPDLQKMVNEGKERIQSMALIHQNLYESEELSGVNIRAYLEELGQNIAQSQRGENIELEL